MPVLTNQRHELFAQALAKGMTQDRAYEVAGYKPDAPHASRLASNGNIQTRVLELQQKGAERVGVTIASLTAECDEALALAREIRNPTAMVAAIKEKGVLSGKRIERRETGEPGEFDWLERASDKQLQAFIETGVVPTDASKLN